MSYAKSADKHAPLSSRGQVAAQLSSLWRPLLLLPPSPLQHHIMWHFCHFAKSTSFVEEKVVQLSVPSQRKQAITEFVQGVLRASWSAGFLKGKGGGGGVLGPLACELSEEGVDRGWEGACLGVEEALDLLGRVVRGVKRRRGGEEDERVVMQRVAEIARKATLIAKH